MMRSVSISVGVLLLAALAFCAHPVQGQPPQPTLRIYDEAQTVYLGNIARRQNGVPPLRWNWQLTQAARWFSWDSTENRPEPFCGHQDTQGQWPGFRASTYGFKGGAGAENCFCGYVTPQQGIDGWMNSPGHRANLLDANSWEIGLGYYLRESDFRGYVTQDFGHDSAYPPVIMENEAINTTSNLVNLYIYREVGGGFSAMGTAVSMQVSNDPCFSGAAWEPYVAEKRWSLLPGSGWRTVYVKTQDAIDRTTVVSDVIFLGPNVPLREIGPAQMSNVQDRVTLHNLQSSAWPFVQFSPGWAVDDTFGTFDRLWGNGERVNDAAAMGGTAFRMRPGDGESGSWVWTTEFVRDIPLVAYFRLKVSENSSSGEVARVSISGGGQEYGPLSLRGTDFRVANGYQEFPLAFVFHNRTDDPFLILKFWRSGPADVYVDAVSIFTAPQAAAPSISWSVPGGNYRGQGVWIRYTDNAGHFSAFQEADTIAPELRVLPESLSALVATHEPVLAPYTLTVERRGCRYFDWQARSSAPWVRLSRTGDTLTVEINHSTLAMGNYQATITIEATNLPGLATTWVPVRLYVTEQMLQQYLPVVSRI